MCALIVSTWKLPHKHITSRAREDSMAEEPHPPVLSVEVEDPLPGSAYATSDVLWAAAKVIGPSCAAQNLSFLRCKKEDPAPLHCITKGKEVSSCVTEVLRKADAKCSESFLKYQACLDKAHGKYEKCRATQAAFEECFNGVP